MDTTWTRLGQMIITVIVLGVVDFDGELNPMARALGRVTVTGNRGAGEGGSNRELR